MYLTFTVFPILRSLPIPVPFTLEKEKEEPRISEFLINLLGFCRDFEEKLGLFAHDFLHDLLFFHIAFGDFFSEIEGGI